MVSVSLVNKMSQYLNKQVAYFFPDGVDPKQEELRKIVDVSLHELKTSFSYLTDKYYQGDFDKIFNYLHGDHYSMFLYLVSRNAFKLVNNENLASKLFLLNKSLHGIDAYYKVDLPEVFLFVHPVGTILGNGKYSNFFCVYQNCTVGTKVDRSVYPVFGERTVLYSNVSVIGECKCGDNVVFAAGSCLIDTEVATNKMVLNTYPENRFLDIGRDQFAYIFRD